MNQMDRLTGIILLLTGALLLSLAACSTVRITAFWVDPTFQRSQLRSVLVLGISQQDLFRRTFEDEMVNRLRQYGLKAVPAYRSISDRELPRETEMEQWLGTQQVDGVLVSRLVGTRRETVVSPGYTTPVGPPYPPYWRGSRYPWVDPYHGWYDYYSGSYDVIHQPPQVSHYEVYTVETTLYLVASDQPVWSARSEITPAKDLNRAIEKFVSQLVDNMADNGVI